MNIVEIGSMIDKTRQINPLIHHITNYVTVNDCANITLAIGASPVMADEIDEVEEIVSIASSLVINIGTLNKRTIESMFLAAKTANIKQIPIILDPVGAGATKLRTETALKLMSQFRVSVIRGNASEIKVLVQGHGFTRGVDATGDNTFESVGEIAVQLAKKTGSVVAVTGATDIIVDSSQVALVSNGHPMMSKVTGTGCMCTSVIGSVCGAKRNIFAATVAGIAAMGIAGELAYERLAEPKLGNATYRNLIIDEIAAMNAEKIISNGKVTLEKAI